MKRLYLMFAFMVLFGCAGLPQEVAAEEIVLRRLLNLPIEKLVFATHMPETWEVRL